jgi:predicted nucleic acid-binding protein
VIAADTSVVVRYLVGSPVEQAGRAVRLIEGEQQVALPVVVLVEAAHVLRTQYGLPRSDVVDALLELITRENIEVVGLATRDAIEALVAARAMPDRPAPDALILFMARAARTLPVYTFDRGMGRYGIPVAQP